MFDLHDIHKNIVIESIHAIYYSELHRNHVFSGESHDFWEIIYIDHGKVYGKIDTNSFILEKNEFMLIMPNSFHDLQTDKTNASNILNLSFRCNSKLLYPIANSCEKVSAFQLDILKMILDIFEIQRKDIFEINLLNDIVSSKSSSFKDQMIANLIELFLIDFINKDAPKQKKYFLFNNDNLDTDAKIIVEVIESNIYRPISLELLSHATGISKGKIREIVKLNFSMALKELINSMKINKAKILLRESALNISEISEILGFSTISYFSDTFYRFAGIRPQEYAKSVKK